MLSKARIKFIKSLQIKKYRKQEQCFLVQGAKSVQELLTSDFETVLIAGTSQFLEGLPHPAGHAEMVETSEKELATLGEFQSNDTAIAVARIKPNVGFPIEPEAFVLVLDDVRDPGNLGTIIRSADWYGFNRIIASPETADFYNPKVISSTMGSFTRAEFFYTEIGSVLANAPGKVYGAFLEGKNVHDETFAAGGMVVIGNESRGISSQHEKFITDRVTIPRYGAAESLNAAVATAIICDNIRRSMTHR
jgi:RNA methyltransferase, TrmH family